MNFEQYLISIGHKPFFLNPQNWKFESPTSFSSLGNIFHSYFPDDNPSIEDRGKEIMYGLSEKGKPPTLIKPRPKINGSNKYNDDMMNKALSYFSPVEIFKAMYDGSINLIL